MPRYISSYSKLNLIFYPEQYFRNIPQSKQCNYKYITTIICS